MTTRFTVMASPALPRGLSLEGLENSLYVAPLAPLSGVAAQAAVASGQGWSLAGGPLCFSQCLVLLRQDGRIYQSVCGFADLIDWSEMEGPDVARHVGRLVKRIGAARPDYAGLSMDRPRIMGIVNVTPDSFSDGGSWFDADKAITHGLALLEAGADILDVGGESTRPGSQPVPTEEEIRRVVPVIRALAERGAVVSVDTRNAPVMTAAVEAGAAIINDISALEGPGALQAAATSGAAVMLMHMQGDPQTMQQDPVYDWAALDVYDYLAQRVALCEAAGIPRQKICVDPGVGFGKSLDHNMEVMAHQGLYHALGLPILLGVSRKSFIAKASKGEPAGQRLAGSLTAALAGLDQGVQMLRVHDVAETAQALAVWRGLKAAG